MVPIALGTQTGGSIQRPASFCGVVGYKPTFGLISRQGVKLAAENLDTVGLLARTVEDLELAMRVLTNAEPNQWHVRETKLRIGLCRTPLWDTAEETTKRVVLDAATRLGSQGHVVTALELPAPFSELSATREIINDYERARAIAHEWRTNRDLISETLAESILRGGAIAADRYIGALRHLELCRGALAPFFGSFDALLAPTAPGEAPVGLSSTGDHRFQSIWTQMRNPTIHLPTHAGSNGMPLGIQLIGRPNGDRDLFAVARHVFDIIGRGHTADTPDHFGS
jgi:amidase